jgi:cell division septation protein DedD
MVVGLLTGCGTSEQTEETSAPLAPPPTQPAPPAPPEYRSQVDTVSALQAAPLSPDSSGAAAAQERYVVQIGAFKDPALANTAQSLARQRYAMTVLNDYNPLVGLYQIRVGFFDTKEEAYLFRARIQKEFPEEYTDAWVVQFK